MKKYLLIILLVFTFTPELFSQIGIYPQAVFLDPKNRSSNLKVMNNTDQPKEVSIELKFGYPGSDSLGIVQMIIGDSLPEAKFSACPFVKVFPKKLILKGKEEQTVRFMLGNIGSIPDGTYFGRIFIESKNPPEVVDTAYIDNIRAKLDVRFTLMSAIIIEKGKKECKLKILNSGCYTDSANVNILVGFERTGNSPFLGTAEINVFDKDGKKIADSKQLTPIYFTSKRSFQINKNKFQPGKYKVELKMTDEHKDIPKDFKIPFETVSDSFYIDVNGN